MGEPLQLHHCITVRPHGNWMNFRQTREKPSKAKIQKGAGPVLPAEIATRPPWDRQSQKASHTMDTLSHWNLQTQRMSSKSNKLFEAPQILHPLQRISRKWPDYVSKHKILFITSQNFWLVLRNTNKTVMPVMREIVKGLPHKVQLLR